MQIKYTGLSLANNAFIIYQVVSQMADTVYTCKYAIYIMSLIQ